ncbi:MAG: vWA domain-containing protein, partial [Planctomycetota bacterium]
MHPLMAVWPIVVGAATRDEARRDQGGSVVVTELRHTPEGWTAIAGGVLLGVLLWAVVWMYRREGRIGASARVRMLLAMLRCAVLVALAVIFLEPVRVRILRRWIDSYTVVLADDSSSMDLTDRYRDESSAARVEAVLGGLVRDSNLAPAAVRRREIVERILNREDHKFFRDLVSNNRVKLYSFSDDAKLQANLRASRETSTTSSEPSSGAAAFSSLYELPAEFPATGPATNLDRALRRAVESLGSAPIAGVVVLTDGGINQGAPAEEIARFANDRRLAVHTIGVGDPSVPRNVRITEILAPQNAFQQDPFAITATLTSQGIEGETIRVHLRERNASDGGEGRIVDTRTLVVGPGGALGSVTFERRQERVGRFTYSVEAPPVEDESVTEDNSKQTTVNVIDTRTRVL